MASVIQYKNEAEELHKTTDEQHIYKDFPWFNHHNLLVNQIIHIDFIIPINGSIVQQLDPILLRLLLTKEVL